MVDVSASLLVFWRDGGKENDSGVLPDVSIGLGAARPRYLHALCEETVKQSKPRFPSLKDKHDVKMQTFLAYNPRIFHPILHETSALLY